MTKLIQNKDRILKASFATCHICYFAGVGFGIHEISSYGALVILALMGIGKVCHIQLEG
jgi:hypothetical protein